MVPFKGTIEQTDRKKNPNHVLHLIAEKCFFFFSVWDDSYGDRDQSLFFWSHWFKVNRDYCNSLKELEENEIVISITLGAKKKNQGYMLYVISQSVEC